VTAGSKREDVNSDRPNVRRLTVICALVVSVGVLAQAAGGAHGSQATPVRLQAELACLPTGGASVTFTVANIGRRPLAIDQDFHLELTVVRSGGPEPAGAAFVFPIPELALIQPGAQSTFVVPIGDAIEPGEPGTDLSGRRILLEAEVFFEGRRKPVRRVFSFRACRAPVIGLSASATSI
jgi:hypothetical protein